MADKITLYNINDFEPQEYVKVKHGHWIDSIEDFQGMPARIKRCSVCGKARPMKIFSNDGFAHNYCANCGSKMDEVKK